MPNSIHIAGIQVMKIGIDRGIKISEVLSATGTLKKGIPPKRTSIGIR